MALHKKMAKCHLLAIPYLAYCFLGNTILYEDSRASRMLNGMTDHVGPLSFCPEGPVNSGQSSDGKTFISV